MKFVKQNLVPIICGVIILLALVAWLIWPLPGMADSVQAQIKERSAQAAQANALITNITIPGGETLKNVTYTPNVIKAGADAVQSLDTQLKKITALASDSNKAGRVQMDGKIEVPVLGGKGGRPQPNYLPVLNRSLAGAQNFAFEYQNLLKIWNIELAGKDIIAMPPVQGDLQAKYEAQQRAAAVPGGGASIFGGGGGGAVDPNEEKKFEKRALASRADEIHMYVDQNAFQPRSFVGRRTPPNEYEIFNGLVDSWLEGDVVRAIQATNAKSTNVGTSPIKRLEHIFVGVSPAGQANTGGGGQATIFLVTQQPGAAPLPAPVAGTDYSRTMTGRVDNTQYDVVLMNVVMDLDPAYENLFIDNLYRQNNGYTVLNIKTTTVDPFDAASNGYLYGNTQVVHVEILVESLLFRSWTVPIMDNLHRAQLGIPAFDPNAPAPAAAPQ